MTQQFLRRLAARSGSILLPALLLALPAAARADSREEISREVHKTLSLKAGQRLEVEHQNGDVRLRGVAGGELKVDAKIRVSSSDMEEAKKFADAISLEIASTATGARVRTHYPDGKWFSGSRRVSFAVDYDIMVPEAAAVSVRNRFGDVSAENLKGGTEIHNANGRLTFRGGKGLARLENSFGPLELAGNSGDAEISNANGTMTIAEVDGLLQARNRFGRVTIARAKKVDFSGSNADVSVSVSGPSSVTTSFGAVSVVTVTGDLKVQNNNGAVSASGVTGETELNGSFAPITFSDIGKTVRCVGTNARVSGRKVGGPVNVQNTFGPVELSDISGSVDVQNTNGSVRLRDIRGGAIVRNRFGTVDLAGIAGDATVTNGNGTVSLANVEGAVDARNSFGQVTVARAKKGAKVNSGNGGVSLSDVGAACFVKTSFALVEAARIAGDLTVENSNGAVRASDVKGALDVRTSFSPVTLETIAGPVRVDNQNGSVEVRDVTFGGKACNRVSLKTSFAPIRLSLPANGGYTLSAQTSFGKISSELPVTTTGAVGGDSLRGTIGDGRCEVTLSNQNGNIDLVRQAGR
ncbi:MAG: hypothetical protein M3167_07510 [Acidobacteriota bacterium]|nr:hypothetical protein [Acidobacteriota bacterium]